MNSICSPSSFMSLPSLGYSPSPPSPHQRLLLHNRCSYHVSFAGVHLSSLPACFTITSPKPACSKISPISAVAPSDEGAVSVINFEDFMDKDWSFLDADDINSDEAFKWNTDRIISAGEVVETSKVFVSTGSEGFVDRLVDSSPCQQLLVVHDSLLVLACIKEKHDNVNCWQGELIDVPEEWGSFDIIFLYFLPALSFELGQVFGALAKLCSPGARVVISHPQGREVLEQQRRQYPDVIVSNLPDEATLISVAANHSFEMADFSDEPGLYLAVLKFKN